MRCWLLPIFVVRSCAQWLVTNLESCWGVDECVACSVVLMRCSTSGLIALADHQHLSPLKNQRRLPLPDHVISSSSKNHTHSLYLCSQRRGQQDPGCWDRGGGSGSGASLPDEGPPPLDRVVLKVQEEVLDTDDLPDAKVSLSESTGPAASMSLSLYLALRQCRSVCI